MLYFIVGCIVFIMFFVGFCWWQNEDGDGYPIIAFMAICAGLIWPISIVIGVLMGIGILILNRLRSV